MIAIYKKFRENQKIQKYEWKVNRIYNQAKIGTFKLRQLYIFSENKKISKLKSEVSQKQSEITNIIEIHNRASGSYEAHIHHMHRDNNDNVKWIENAISETKRLETKLKTLQNSIQTLLDKKAELTKENEDLKSKVSDANIEDIIEFQSFDEINLDQIEERKSQEMQVDFEVSEQKLWNIPELGLQMNNLSFSLNDSDLDDILSSQNNDSSEKVPPKRNTNEALQSKILIEEISLNTEDLNFSDDE